MRRTRVNRRGGDKGLRGVHWTKAVCKVGTKRHLAGLSLAHSTVSHTHAWYQVSSQVGQRLPKTRRQDIHGCGCSAPDSSNVNDDMPGLQWMTNIESTVFGAYGALNVLKSIFARAHATVVSDHPGTCSAV